MSIEVLDPTHESGAQGVLLAPRLSGLQGATIAVISNGKQGTIRFFDAFEEELLARHQVARVVRLTKSNYSAPAEAEILHQAADCDALIAGVGD